MIDETLDRLRDSLTAATDRLKSEDFLKRQARLVEIEAEAQAAMAKFNAEREQLASSLENDEATYEDAKDAMVNYCANYLEGADMSGPEAEEVLFGTDPHFAIVDAESDEFASPRANGAYTD